MATSGKGRRDLHAGAIHGNVNGQLRQASPARAGGCIADQSSGARDEVRERERTSADAPETFGLMGTRAGEGQRVVPRSVHTKRSNPDGKG
jgi:hypothetical protein